ncbi:Lsr2 family protein [Micromonospora sp. WMMD710]|uniref:histone-like nucleoid-structuring protein Lsr2 n=1 Tax=Micromonospora sp. WMMD710 TaxID=3016085 RepID=UPI002415BE5D|nr:Lsr2 family protein [Micromonospora sp. WMMD710]MDG4760365.1 Lsr2 family protein [Micromonospora sp. WMMD710]
MATKTVVVLTDDLDHSTEDVSTHRLAFNDVEYEIDLAPHNLQRLREALSPYVEAARRQPKRPTSQRRGPSPRAGYPADVRAFWETNEKPLQLPPHRRHGPIPPAVYDAYRTAAARTTGQGTR